MAILKYHVLFGLICYAVCLVMIKVKFTCIKAMGYKKKVESKFPLVIDAYIRLFAVCMVPIFNFIIALALVFMSNEYLIEKYLEDGIIIKAVKK